MRGEMFDGDVRGVGCERKRTERNLLFIWFFEKLEGIKREKIPFSFLLLLDFLLIFFNHGHFSVDLIFDIFGSWHTEYGTSGS